jgi:hypothetical protein
MLIIVDPCVIQQPFLGNIQGHEIQGIHAPFFFLPLASLQL